MIKSITSLAIVALALVSTVSKAETDVHFVSDELLTTKVSNIRFTKTFSKWYWRPSSHVNIAIDAVVKNQSTGNAKGPVRVLLKKPSWIEVENAVGYDTFGNAIIEVCKECVIPGEDKSDSFSIKLSMPIIRSFDWIKHVGIATQYSPFKLQLLHTADMDGTAGALQNVEAFSSILNTLRSQFPENTLVLSSGDNYIPGPRFAACADESLTAIIGIAGEGRCDMAFLNAMGFQASVVGNHDLDTGTDGFAGIISPEVNTVTGETYSGAQFPYLSANLDFSTDANVAGLVTSDGQAAADINGRLAAYTVIDVHGETIGVVGATTPILADITDTGDITITPEDATDIPALAAEIQVSVDALTSLGINKIIVLAHMQQIAIEEELATLLSDVDVIVAGGSNTILADSTDSLRDGDVAAGTYPLVFDSASQEPVLVVNTDGDYRYLGRLVGAFDLQGRIILDSLNEQINGAYASNEEGLNNVGNPAPIEAVSVVATALSDVLAVRDGNILGNASVFLDGRRNQVRTEETNLGNLTADANLALAQQVDPSTVISIKNGGGIRSEIGFFAFPAGSTDPDDLEFFPTAPNAAAGKEAGDISQFDIETALSFNNGLTLLTVTAAELQELIEHAVSATEDGATPGQFAQVGGVKFSFDPSLEPNSRVQSLAVVDSNGSVTDTVVANGALQGDASRTFRVVTLTFLADGGDSYPFPETDRIDLEGNVLTPVGSSSFAGDGSEQDALAEYLLSNTSDDAPFATQETPIEEDQRIQNLSVRADTVLQ